MENPLLVFISSVMNKQLESLDEERQAVRQAIEQIPLARPWLFEFSPASTDTLEESYLAKVRECDIFVLILGGRLCSAVKREWQEAKSRPRLVFIKSSEVGQLDRDEETQRFISEVDVKCKQFVNLGELRKEVPKAIIDELIKGYRRYGLLPTDVRRSLNTSSYLPPPFIPLDRALPECLIKRHDEVTNLKSFLSQKGKGKNCGITAITGMGGVGKSVLARYVCEDDDIKNCFPGGIISQSMPREYQYLTETFRSIGKQLGDDVDCYTDQHSARARLEQILEKRAVLIILDNVTDASLAERFVFKSPLCHILLTTRSGLIVDRLQANEVRLKGFDDNQSIEFLKQTAGVETETPELAKIAKCLYCHPLALFIAGRTIRKGMSPSEWYRVYHDQVSILKLDPDSKKPEDNVAVSISISTDSLEPNHKLLYHSLGIFPENHRIPVSLVSRLWQRLYNIKGLNEKSDVGVFKQLLHTLARLALIEYDDERIFVHDLLHDYNQHALGEEELVCHQAMLQVLNPDNKEWYSLNGEVLTEHNHYICRFLPHHMEGAHQEDNLWAQFRSATTWMERNRAKPDFLRESLLVTIWHSWWKKQNEEAKTFLKHNWLPLKIPSKNIGYTARTIAVRCAGEVDFDDGIALGLCHSDERVRIAALNHVYSLSHYDSKRVVRILGIATNKIVGRFWLPKVHVIKSVLSTIIIVFNQFQLVKDQGSDYNELFFLLRKIIRSITQKTVLRLFGPRSRIFVTRIFYPFLRMRLMEAGSVSPNNFNALNAFFLQPFGIRNYTIQSLKYLDVNHGSPGDLKDVLPKLLFVAGNKPADRISGLVAEGILIAHGITDFSRVEAIIKDIAGRENGSCRASMTATHVLYSIMAQRRDTITDRTLKTMKEFVSQWLESSRQHGYGKVKDEYGCYQVYPLSYYAALWMIARPKEDVDLLNEYAKSAEELNDEDLRFHIAGMFGDSRCVLEQIPIALKVLKPYFNNLKTKGRMWKTLVSSLGSVYSLHMNAVKELLEDTSAPLELREEIEAYSYQRTQALLYMRVYQVLTDMLANNNSHYIIDILEHSLTARNLPTFIVKAINQIVDSLYSVKLPKTGASNGVYERI